MAKVTAFVLAGLLAAGCAATYEPPSLKPSTSAKSPVQGSKGAILDAASRALVLDGYQVVSSSRDAGIISTATKDMRLTEVEADCGTTLGLPYIKDNRTMTTVLVGIVAVDGWVTVKAQVAGKYLENNVVQGISLTCVSTGVLEKDILGKIQSQLN